MAAALSLLRARAPLSAPPTTSDVFALLVESRTALRSVLAKWVATRDEWLRDVQEAETRRQGLFEVFRDLTEQHAHVTDLQSDGRCPICARALGPQWRSVVEVLDSQIESVTIDGKYFRARIEQLAQAPAAAVEELVDGALTGAWEAWPNTNGVPMPAFPPPKPEADATAEEAAALNEPPPPSDDDMPSDDLPFDDWTGE